MSEEFNIKLNKITFLKVVFVVLLVVKLISKDSITWFAVFIPLMVEFVIMLFAFVMWAVEQNKRRGL